MLSNAKAIKTGKFYQLSFYKRPFKYGYSLPKLPKSATSPISTIDKDTLSRMSTNRAKKQIRRLIIGNNNHYPQYKPVFLTLTFSDDFQSLKQANKHFQLFIKSMNHRLGYRLRYIAVPEFQDRGAVHYHVLLFNLPFIEGKTIENIWEHGGTNICLAKRIRGLFNYLTKDLYKAYSDSRYVNQKRYFYSLDNRPEIISKQEDASEIYYGMRKEELIGKSEYDIKDAHGSSTNHIVNFEYISTFLPNP
jgi:hypothetical protein